MSAQTGVAGSPLALPKGGGAVQGIGETFQPNLFRGTGNFSVPIATSTGRDGFGPELALQYSTGHGNGPFGLGWQLSIPRITRKTEKGLPRYDDRDQFVMSGAEDLVVELKPSDTDPETWEPIEFPYPTGTQAAYTVTRFRPRTEAAFARIERWHRIADGDVHWRATTKENVTSVYGKSASARIANPVDRDEVFQWLLEETFDAKGNHLLYEYAQEDDQRAADPLHEANRRPCQAYIRRILYGNTPVEVGPKRLATDHRDPMGTMERHYSLELFFDYEMMEPTSRSITDRPIGDWPLRPDPFSSFRSGFEIRTLRRCQRVLMLHHFHELAGQTLVRSTDFEYETNGDNLLSLLSTVTVTGYRVDSTTSELKRRSLPPVSFNYSAFEPERQRYQSISADRDDLPAESLADPDMALVDLSGNGLPDILHTSDLGFRYWKNLGDGHFDRPHPFHASPAGVKLSRPGVTMADMGGDGRADLLIRSGPVTGFFETQPGATWETFKPIDSIPVDFADPNARKLDLTGDGLTDWLVTRDHHFLWYQCLGEDGYAEAQFIERVHDDNEFPDLYFDDPAGRVRLADMSGDGLQDIVLVHNGRIDYWPNLGYGRFGRRITMSDSPRLEHDFDPARLFLVDLDGSGCSDLVYVDFDRVHFWFNRSGNSWSDERIIHGTPATINATAVQFSDILGSGTSSLVWSNGLGLQAGGNYRVLDFCGGVKPYMLVEMSNSRGSTTRIRYAASTKFAIEDEKRGQPWATPLPFPVQVVEKTEAIDHVSRTKLVTTYDYHHGYFDGHEREFRGFGRVDQYDTESFDLFERPDLHEVELENADRQHHVPPVLTKTWFHTGAYFESGDQIAQRFESEYYSGDGQAFEHAGIVADPNPEAHRALRGSLLRSEVYGLDGSEHSIHPYNVTASTYETRQLQPRSEHAHPVHLTVELETITHHYERNPADPRVNHMLNLEVDNFGNVIKRVSIGYPRRVDSEHDEQTQLHGTLSQTRFINTADYLPDDANFYFAGVPCESHVFEIAALADDWAGDVAFTAEELASKIADSDNFHPYETDSASAPGSLRILKWSRTYFRQDSAAEQLLPPETCRDVWNWGALIGSVCRWKRFKPSFRLGFSPNCLTIG